MSDVVRLKKQSRVSLDRIKFQIMAHYPDKHIHLLLSDSYIINEALEHLLNSMEEGDYFGEI